MRIAVFLNGFAALSRRFVLNQIYGMIDREHDVDIYATPQVKSYRLLDKTGFFDLPKGYLERLIRITGHIVKRGYGVGQA